MLSSFITKPACHECDVELMLMIKVIRPTWCQHQRKNLNRHRERAVSVWVLWQSNPVISVKNPKLYMMSKASKMTPSSMSARREKRNSTRGYWRVTDVVFWKAKLRSWQDMWGVFLRFSETGWIRRTETNSFCWGFFFFVVLYTNKLVAQDGYLQ